VISEKSVTYQPCENVSDIGKLTLRIEEVRNRNTVILLVMDSSVLEHLLDMGLRSDTHVLLTEMLDMSVHVCRSKLLAERDLLQRHLVDAGVGCAKQRCCGEECTFHDCDLSNVLSLSK
jgi:hypothetical protein